MKNILKSAKYLLMLGLVFGSMNLATTEAFARAKINTVYVLQGEGSCSEYLQIDFYDDDSAVITVLSSYGYG